MATFDLAAMSKAIAEAFLPSMTDSFSKQMLSQFFAIPEVVRTAWDDDLDHPDDRTYRIPAWNYSYASLDKQG